MTVPIARASGWGWADCKMPVWSKGHLSFVHSHRNALAGCITAVSPEWVPALQLFSYPTESPRPSQSSTATPDPRTPTAPGVVPELSHREEGVILTLFPTRTLPYQCAHHLPGLSLQTGPEMPKGPQSLPQGSGGLANTLI